MNYPNSYPSLAKLLKRHNILVTSENLFLCLDVDAGQLTPTIYKILELVWLSVKDTHFLVLRGVPFCFLPYARHRILYPGLRKQTTRTIEACGSCCLQGKCPGWPAKSSYPLSRIQPVIDMPNEIVFEITARCNLSCRYCTGIKQAHTELSFAQVRTVLDEALALGIRAVRFTGGEPLLHPELLQMLSLAKQMGFYVLLNTNATILPDATRQVLARTVDNILVSLQGHDADSEKELTNDAQHSFTEKIRHLFQLRTIIPIFRVGTVISQPLLDRLPAYFLFIKTLRPNSWELFRPMALPLTDPRSEIPAFQKLLKTLLYMNQQGLRAILANAMPFCVLPDLTMAASVLLGAASDDGHSRLVMDARGYFKSSYFMPENIGPTIHSAWHSAERKNNCSVSLLPDACQSCDHFNWCLAGSRSMARFCSGTYQDLDPLFTTRPSNARHIMPGRNV